MKEQSERKKLHENDELFDYDPLERAMHALSFAENSTKKKSIYRAVFYRFPKLKIPTPVPNHLVFEVDMEFIKYSDLPEGISGWHNPEKYRPMPFDLVELLLKDKIVQGWWTGNGWDGLRLKKSDKVKKWKKTAELNFI